MKKNKANLIALIIISSFIIAEIIELIIYKQKILSEKSLVNFWLSDPSKSEQLHNAGMFLNGYICPSMWHVYMDIILNTFIMIIMFLAPFFVIIPGTYAIFEIVKTGYIKYIVNTRKKYKDYIKHLIKNCYKYSIITPIMFLLLILGSGIITDFNISLSNSDYNIFYSTFNNSYLYIIFISINLLLANIYYINVGLLTMLKTKNFLLNSIFSYLVIIIVAILLQTVFGYSLAMITGNSIFANIFNFYGIWIASADMGNALYTTLFLSILVIITSIFVYFNYKNEEKVINNV